MINIRAQNSASFQQGCMVMKKVNESPGVHEKLDTVMVALQLKCRDIICTLVCYNLDSCLIS